MKDQEEIKKRKKNIRDKTSSSSSQHNKKKRRNNNTPNNSENIRSITKDLKSMKTDLKPTRTIQIFDVSNIDIQMNVDTQRENSNPNTKEPCDVVNDALDLFLSCTCILIYCAT